MTTIPNLSNLNDSVLPQFFLAGLLWGLRSRRPCRSGHALDFASEALRGERQVVLKAVRENKGAMAYASKARHGAAMRIRLRIDKDIEWYSIDRCDGGMNGLRFIG